MSRAAAVALELANQLSEVQEEIEAQRRKLRRLIDGAKNAELLTSEEEKLLKLVMKDLELAAVGVEEVAEDLRPE